MPDTTIFPSITPTHREDSTADSVTVSFANDVCPWCEETFDNVKAHASQAHPDEWEAWKADSEG